MSVFSGTRVIDFTNNVAGPVCTAILGDMGAEVIKIERPVAGDDSRSIAPRIEGQSLQYLWYNRSKKSVEIALDDPEAVELLYKLIADADVVVESFKPGQMKKFRLDYKTVIQYNPQIVYCSISACGQTGAYSNKPGFDIIAQGMSGMMDLCGDPNGPPVKHGSAIGDYVGALSAYGAVVTALLHKLKTGEGQYIDISLLDGLIACNSQIESAAMLGNHPTRVGRHHVTMAPYGVFLGKSGQSVIIAAYTAAMWKRLCTAMGRPDLLEDPRFFTVPLRAKNIGQLVSEIEDWLGRFDDIGEAIAILEGEGVACCKIRSTYEAANDPVLWERGTFMDLPTPPSLKDCRTVRARAPWMRFSKTPAVPAAAPDLGQHNYEILEKYGWEKAKINDKRELWTHKAENH